MATTIRGSDNFDTNNVATQTELDVVDGQLLGVGQTWQNVTASRSAGVTYTNTTGKPIIVSAGADRSAGIYNYKMIATIDGLSVNFAQSSNEVGNTSAGGTIVIPTGSTYKITSSNSNAIDWWFELR